MVHARDALRLMAMPQTPPWTRFAGCARGAAVAAALAIAVWAAPGDARAPCALADDASCIAETGETAPPAPPSPPAPLGKLINRLDEIGPLLSRCLQLPPSDLFRPGMRVTLRLAFTRDGAILGEPRFTFTTPGVAAEIRAAYQRAMVDMLDRCTPLPITKELGGAIAGRPFVIPLVDTRFEKRADNANDPEPRRQS
jgi:hypothetical protein